MSFAPDGQKLFEPSFNLAALSSSKYKESPLLEEFKTDPPPTEEVKKKKKKSFPGHKREREKILWRLAGYFREGRTWQS